MNPMNESKLYLSIDDHRVLSHLTGALAGKTGTVDRLRAELARAIVLDPSAVPATAVGLNSHVRLEDLDTHECEEYRIVLPHTADATQQRISVLAPVGTALLGYGEGDEIEWPTPGGLRRLRVLQVTRAT